MKNKHLMILGIIAIIVLCLISILMSRKENDESKLLKILVKSNTGIPYKWVYKIDDDSIVKYVSTKEVSSKNEPTTGGEVVYEYKFKGLKQGTTVITLQNVSIENEEEVLDFNIYKVRVDEHKKITIVASSK